MGEHIEQILRLAHQLVKPAPRKLQKLGPQALDLSERDLGAHGGVKRLGHSRPGMLNGRWQMLQRQRVDFFAAPLGTG